MPQFSEDPATPVAPPSSAARRHLRPWLPSLLVVALGAISPTLSQREAQLEELIERLGDRAEVYERTALRFSCREEATVSKYNSGETVRKQAVDYHDYLLEYTESHGVVPYRALLSHNGKSARRREVSPSYEVPEPYAWHLLFTRSFGIVSSSPLWAKRSSLRISPG